MITTNFFSALSNIIPEGKLTINVDFKSNRALVSLLYTGDSQKDSILKGIPPLLLKGAITEIDQLFFVTIQKPVEATVTLFLNSKEYEQTQQQVLKKAK